MSTLESGDFAPVDDVPELEVEIDDPWRKSCRKRLKAMGRIQDDLAEHIGCSQSGVSQALSLTKPQATSKLAFKITIALGLKMPRRWRALRLISIMEQSYPEALEYQLRAWEATYLKSADS